MSQRLLGTMITTTSYGTWLPGDICGYVDEGVILPGDPCVLDRAKALLSKEPVFFDPVQRKVLFGALCKACNEFDYRLLCVSIDRWHAHWLVDHAFDAVERMVGRLKTRMRQALSRGRIWTEGYDKRFCVTPEMIAVRVEYIRRHAGHIVVPEPPLTPGRAGG